MKLRVYAPLIAALIGFGISSASAQDFPVRAVRLVVPFGAGTSTDITSRIIAQGLTQYLKQPIVVENKPGAGGNIGTEVVAKAKPDGYTLTMGTVGTLSINTSLYRKISFDPLRDFVPISFMGFTPTLIVAKPSAPFANAAELVAYAKKNPGKLTFSSAGNGTTGHLAGELLKTMSGASIIHAPFKEGAQALTAVIAGEVDFMFYHPAAVMSYVNAGRLKAIAASGSRRAAAAPNVPTVAESGFPGFDLIAWYMMAAPAGTPPAVTSKLIDASERTLKNPEILQKLDSLGIEQSAIPADKLRGFLENEIAKWAKVIQASGAHVD